MKKTHVLALTYEERQEVATLHPKLWESLWRREKVVYYSHPIVCYEVDANTAVLWRFFGYGVISDDPTLADALYRINHSLFASWGRDIRQSLHSLGDNALPRSVQDFQEQVVARNKMQFGGR